MQNTSQTIEIGHDFSRSKEALYSAWTDPEQLKQWWKPLGKQLVEVANELHEDGQVKYVFDDDLVIEGKYKNVQPNKLLEYTWNWHLSSDNIEDTEHQLSVRFDGDEERSSIRVIQTGFSNSESIHPHQQGWEHGLEQLHHYLENISSTGNMQKQKQPITGYNETPEQLKVGGG